MNDVIGRLVARALPHPGGVRPRVVSHFEQETSATAASLQLPGPEAMQSPEMRRDALVHHEPIPKQPESVATVPGHAVPERRSPPLFKSPQTVPDRDETFALVSSNPPEIEVTSGLRPPLLDQVDDAGPSAMPYTAQSSRDRIELHHVPLLPSQIPSFEPVAPPVPPYPGPRRDAAPHDHDVHISIGRIEFRAARPERRPPSARAGPPQFMPLEAYLAGKGKRQ